MGHTSNAGSLAWKLHKTAWVLAWLSVGGLLCLLAAAFLRLYGSAPANPIAVEAVQWGIPVVSFGLVAVCVLRWLQWLVGGTAVFEVSGGRPGRRLRLYRGRTRS
jgi:hypothetical protein